MKILTVSDRVDELIYSTALRRVLGDVDVVLSCGDLPHYYLEFIVTLLGGPLFYVMGNHAHEIRSLYEAPENWIYPRGCENIDGRVVRYRGLLLAGLEGSMRYNQNPYFQYAEHEMALKVWRLVPALIVNKLRYGRYLDILITHAPPYGIHDRPDRCHQGFKTLRTFMDRFRPQYLIHGHVHLYSPNQIFETRYRQTMVINTYGYRTLRIGEGASL